MLIRFGISIESNLINDFDALIKEKGYENRSEAIRDLIRDSLIQAEIQDPEQQIVGTLTLVYDHHGNDLSDKLNHLQHEYFQTIVSTTHVHLDEHNCLEVLILKGECRDIKSIAEKLISTKGIKNGKLVLTSIL